MVAYAQFHSLESDVARGFVQIIKAMDSVYLEWKRDEHAQEEKQRELAKKMAERRTALEDDDGG